MGVGIEWRGLAVCVARSAVLTPVSRTGDRVARLPEIGRARLVGNSRNHSALLPALDFPKRVAAKLEVVPLLVDRVAAAAVDQNSIIDSRDHILQRRFLRPGFQPYIGHALERNRRP